MTWTWSNMKKDSDAAATRIIRVTAHAAEAVMETKAFGYVEKAAYQTVVYGAVLPINVTQKVVGPRYNSFVKRMDEWANTPLASEKK